MAPLSSTSESGRTSGRIFDGDQHSVHAHTAELQQNTHTGTTHQKVRSQKSGRRALAKPLQASPYSHFTPVSSYVDILYALRIATLGPGKCTREVGRTGSFHRSNTSKPASTTRHQVCRLARLLGPTPTRHHHHLGRRLTLYTSIFTTTNLASKSAERMSFPRSGIESAEKSTAKRWRSGGSAAALRKRRAISGRRNWSESSKSGMQGPTVNQKGNNGMTVNGLQLRMVAKGSKPQLSLQLSLYDVAL